MTIHTDCQQKRETADSELCCFGWPQGKTKGKLKRDKYQELTRELKRKNYGTLRWWWCHL